MPMRGKVAADDLVDHLRLVQTDGVGPIAYRRLLSRYGSAKRALAALPALAKAGGRPTSPATPSIDDAERQLDRLTKLGARLLVLGMPDYPPLLALLDDAPPVLQVMGDPGALAAAGVAVVGGRNASANGRRMAETLAEELAGSGLTVISGMARGIDAAAHAGALRGGKTVAVIAGGLDIPYPPEHAALQREIAEVGAVVSEMPLGTVPQSRHFPRRNRIIAGLSLGVVVVEAALRSGSLITARIAQEVGRELFAVPGSPLDPRARGSNDLIRQGAHLTETVSDVRANLPDHPLREGLARDPLFARAAVERVAASQEADLVGELADSPSKLLAARDQITNLLSPAATAVDDLVRRCQFSPAAVMAVLLELELAGRIEHLPGHRVALLPETGPHA